jgi:protein-tyrosine phosphatase
MQKTSVLFVCLGNICRSPVAKGVFREIVNAEGLQDRFLIDSCGTGNWHVGEQAHHESRKVALLHQINIEDHISRQLSREDFINFNYIIAMDRSNLRDIKNRAPSSTNYTIRLLRDFDLEDTEPDVPDPYLGADGFHNVHQIITRCCKELFKSLNASL